MKNMSVESMNRSCYKQAINLMAILVTAGLLLPQPAFSETKRTIPAPEFTQVDNNAWINSEPLTLDDLRGNVVLLDVWTYGCGNCRRSVPWVKHLEQRFEGKPFKVIGIHSPEFPWERIRLTVISQVKYLGITHPVMLDNDHAYWNSLHNRYWPAFYILDAEANLVTGAIGETHIGDKRALAIEREIERLIAEIELDVRKNKGSVTTETNS